MMRDGVDKSDRVTFEEFRTVYRQAVDDVFAFWSPAMQDTLGKHNVGYHGDNLDFKGYLQASDIRFFLAYEAVVAGRSDVRVCDVGGFWGAWPLTLVRLGHRATMTEALEYFDEAFDPLFGYLRGEGVEVLDYDPFRDDAALDARFDGVTVMAVLEHYPHSLESFMTNCKTLLDPESTLYIEVPNLAYWPWRVKLLKGESPLVDVGVIYRSNTPFTGHHHEFTMVELSTLVELAGLEERELVTFNYSPTPLRWRSLRPRGAISAIAQELAFRRKMDAREVLAISARLASADEAAE